MRGSKCFTSRLQAWTPQRLHNLEGLGLFCSSLTVIHSTPPLLAYKYINYTRNAWWFGLHDITAGKYINRDEVLLKKKKKQEEALESSPCSVEEENKINLFLQIWQTNFKLDFYLICTVWACVIIQPVLPQTKTCEVCLCIFARPGPSSCAAERK